MRNLKVLLKMLFLTPLSALVLVSLAFTTLNYPSAQFVSPRSSDEISSNFKNYIDSTISEIISRDYGSRRLGKEAIFTILGGTLRVSVAATSSSSSAQGTGVLISSDVDISSKKLKYKSYVVTNYHVVREAKNVKLEAFHYLDEKFISETSNYTGKVVAKSPELDLALIEITSTRSIGQPLKLFNETDLSEISLGEPVYICGCSLGEPPAITNGNLSQASSSQYTVSAFSIFGNSGGGAFTSNCKILGITRRIAAVQTPDGSVHPVPEMSNIIPAIIVREWLLSRGFNFD